MVSIQRSSRATGEPPAASARVSAGLDLAQDALDHRGVELRLGGEVMEERRLAEADRLGDLAQADAGEAAPREQRLGGVENLLARRDVSAATDRILPTDRSVEHYRSNGRLSIDMWRAAACRRCGWAGDGRRASRAHRRETRCYGASSQRSASIAAMQPVPAAVTAWR